MKNPFKVGDHVYVRAQHCSNFGIDGYVCRFSGNEYQYVHIAFGGKVEETNSSKDCGYHFTNIDFYNAKIKDITPTSTEEKNESIWCIFKEKGDAPKRMHSTYAAAKAELEKLAKANAGHRFYLLEAIEELCYEMKYERKELIYKTEEK